MRKGQAIASLDLRPRAVIERERNPRDGWDMDWEWPVPPRVSWSSGEVGVWVHARFARMERMARVFEAMRPVGR